MKKYFLHFLPMLLLFSCSQNKKNNIEATASDTALSQAKANAENNSFIPVTSFIQKEIAELDSLPVTILQVTTINGKQDSAWLPVAKVKPKLQLFLSDVIDVKNLTAYFKETKFNDQSTEAITFMYDPKTVLPDSFSLRKWNVYVDPDKSTLRKVYMVKRVKENNDTLMLQLTWQMGKWAQIATISNKPVGNPVLKEIKWIWDLREETSIPTPVKKSGKEK